MKVNKFMETLGNMLTVRNPWKNGIVAWSSMLVFSIEEGAEIRA